MLITFNRVLTLICMLFLSMWQQKPSLNELITIINITVAISTFPKHTTKRISIILSEWSEYMVIPIVFQICLTRKITIHQVLRTTKFQLENTIIVFMCTAQFSVFKDTTHPTTCLKGAYNFASSCSKYDSLKRIHLQSLLL